MDSHKRQHWIPDTYLDAWCDPDPARQNPRRVYRYDRDGSFRDYRPPSRIFTVDDLYTVPGPGGSRDLKTEHALNRLEDALLDRILLDTAFTRGIRQVLVVGCRARFWEAVTRIPSSMMREVVLMLPDDPQVYRRGPTIRTKPLATIKSIGI
jgi:hypothetical protein